MCERAVEEKSSYNLKFVPDNFITQKMCEKVVEKEPWALRFVPDHLTTQEMCDKLFWEDTFSLQYVPDWFVTQQQIKLQNDNAYYCNNDKLTEWYDGYKKQKAQKALIKDKLMPITWYPSRWWNWCVPEDEKKETEIFF